MEPVVTIRVAPHLQLSHDLITQSLKYLCRSLDCGQVESITKQHQRFWGVYDTSLKVGLWVAPDETMTEMLVGPYDWKNRQPQTDSYQFRELVHQFIFYCFWPLKPMIPWPLVVYSTSPCLGHWQIAIVKHQIEASLGHIEILNSNQVSDQKVAFAFGLNDGEARSNWELHEYELDVTPRGTRVSFAASRRFSERLEVKLERNHYTTIRHHTGHLAHIFT